MAAPPSAEEDDIPVYEAEVRITPREGILDPEGETIASALKNLGYDQVRRVRAGRLVHLRLEAGDAGEARDAVERMCEELIANPVIEDWDVRVREPGAGSGPASPGREASGSGAGTAGGHREPGGGEGGP